MASYLYNTNCDKCGSSRAKAVYADNTAYCFKCQSYFGTTQIKEKAMSNNRAKFTTEEIEHFGTADLSHRGIRKEISKQYGVRQSVDERTGQGNYFLFPSGKGYGWKVKHKKYKDDMFCLGQYKGFFGQDKVSQNRQMVIVVEGEEDCLAAYQMLLDGGYDYAVVSLPNGSNESGTLDRSVAEELDFLSQRKCVVLCLDNDEPGHTTTETLASALITDTRVRVVTLPGKDSNQLLQEGREKEWREAFFNAEEYRPEKLEHGDDVPFEEVYKAIPQGAYIHQFPELMTLSQGLRQGELTTLIAPPGVGKTTVSREITYSLVTQGYKVACFMLEETTVKSRQGLIAIDNNVPLWKFRQDPSIIPEEDAQASYDKLFGSGLCHFVKHRGGMTDNSLLSLIKFYKQVEGVDFIILDHLSMVFSGRQSQDERKEIDNLLTEIASLVEDFQIHMISVAHIRREGNAKITAKDDSGALWHIVHYDAARGSGAFEQLSHNCWALEPEIIETGERGRARLAVRKNREIGTLGVADIIKMDLATGRIIKAEEEF